MKKSIYILGAFCLAFGLSCNKCERQGRTDHLFDLPYSISPYRQSYTQGDTIIIESVFKHNILNTNYNKTFLVQDYDFKIVMSIVDLNSPSPAISYKNPLFITIDGTTIGTNVGAIDYQAIQLSYDYTNGEYRYKSYLIVDKPGKYMFIITSDHNASNRTDVNLTECRNETIKITLNTNNRQDNNFDMLKNAVDQDYRSWSRQEFDEVGGYCFEVK